MGTWVTGSPCDTMGSLEAVKVSFRWAAQSGVLGEVEPLIEWVTGMEQEDLKKIKSKWEG